MFIWSDWIIVVQAPKTSSLEKLLHKIKMPDDMLPSHDYGSHDTFARGDSA